MSDSTLMAWSRVKSWKLNAGKVSTIYKVGADVKTTTVKQALKKPVFWAIMLCAGLGFAVSMVGFAFSSIHFMEKGYELSVITASMSWSSVVRLLFMLVIAKVSDRIEPGYLLGISLAAYGAATLLAPIQAAVSLSSTCIASLP